MQILNTGINIMFLDAWFCWLVAALVFTLLELLSPSFFFFLSFACGCLGTACAAWLVASVLYQCMIFIIIGGMSFYLLYKLSSQLSRPSEKTNTEALIGASGIVIETIDADLPGRVKIRGETWRATTDHGSALHPHTHIIVIAVIGNHLLVRSRT